MKFHELEPGMLIKGYGLIVNIKPDELENTNICYYELQDPYWGPVCGWTNQDGDQEYEVLHERGTPEYDKEVAHIRKAIEKLHNDSIEFLQEIDSLARDGIATKVRPWW